MRQTTSFNSGWSFASGFSQASTTTVLDGTPVTLPHNAVDMPFNYFDETCYQRAFTYQKVIAASDAFIGKEVSVVFDGAMADAEVYFNGQKIIAHKDGYTPFTARLTGLFQAGDNLLTVRIDGTENPEIPPFGGQIDYLTYAGIYRDVWLKVTGPVSIHTMKIETSGTLADAKTVSIQCAIANPQALAFDGTITATLKDSAGNTFGTATAHVSSGWVNLIMADIPGISLWDIDNPSLYTITLDLQTNHGTDSLTAHFGFRTAEFTPEGFLLNGKPLKIRGLNRHQAWPYVGYAMGRTAQERDAEILKNTLKCNLVRTSHYPQSKWFLDHCDRIGLLVFEEIPGWQHIGGDGWKQEAIENVRRMIERDWNHPSIIIWGVRINESQDSHDFYVETNRLARALDTTRQTGGVRYITESEFLEDVYTMNDFIQGQEEMPGHNRPRISLREQQEVTGQPKKVPYIVTEYNGHMYPTKRHDQEQRQAEHVHRHLAILNAMYGDTGISGCIGWCMFDYNTHKDFGSGDRICHHGVMDMFREPKFAAYAYASQCEPSEEVILKPVTFWARGERNIGGVLPLIILTNCDEVEIRYGSHIVKRIGPDRETYPHLPHPPVVLDHRHFSRDELGRWGMSWQDVEFTGFVGGKPVASLKMVADPLPATLEVEADGHSLKAGEKDSLRVIIRGLDQAGQLLPFLDDIITLRVNGPAKLLGPDSLALNGGTTGFWLESTGEAGSVTVDISAARFKGQTLAITAA